MESVTWSFDYNWTLKSRNLARRLAFKTWLSQRTPADEWIHNARNKHAGERCFVLATGPSLNDLDLSLIRNEVTFGVNGTYMIPDLDLTYYVYVSSWWHKNHTDGMKNIKCTRRFIPSDLQEELKSSVPTTYYNKISPIRQYNGEPVPSPLSFSHHADRYLYAGGSVVFICLQLAFFFGFKEVYIIGLDHSYGTAADKLKGLSGGGHIQATRDTPMHFSKNHYASGTSIPLDFVAMERGYQLALDAYAWRGRQIWNASSRSMCDVFPRRPYRTLF